MQEEVKAALVNYITPPQAVELVKKTKILLLVGISGAGKDTVKRHLLESGKYHHIISHTTRPPRANHAKMEQNGVDYHFIDLLTAKNMLERGAFIEAKMYSGNVYGTSIAEIQTAYDTHKIAVTDLEVQGVVEYKHISDVVVAVFLLPPSYMVWKERLKQRYEGGEPDAQDIAKRMQTAMVELRHALETHHFHFVINDNLDETISQVDDIAHHHDTIRREKSAEELARSLLSELESKT